MRSRGRSRSRTCDDRYLPVHLHLLCSFVHGSCRAAYTTLLLRSSKASRGSGRRDTPGDRSGRRCETWHSARGSRRRRSRISSTAVTHLMTEETRERVAEATSRARLSPEPRPRAAALGAQPHAGVPGARPGARFLADPMTDLIIAGIGDIARDRGYGVLIQAGRPDEASDATARRRCSSIARTARSSSSRASRPCGAGTSRAIAELGARAVAFERVDDSPTSRRSPPTTATAHAA